ncbi:MAG: hypothetical protein AAF722_10230 [Cyanobacteria bacterium P01_C01_bin.70]
MTRPRGFDISAMPQRVTLWHAENDAMEPDDAARADRCIPE